jgi:hypothetical protein
MVFWVAAVPGTSRSSPLSARSDEEEAAAAAAAAELPHLRPGVFTTKQQLKRAHRKRDKLARRAARGGAPSGSFPAAAAPPAAEEEEGPSAMLVETSLTFGKFEQHTTGALRQPLGSAR